MLEPKWSTATDWLQIVHFHAVCFSSNYYRLLLLFHRVYIQQIKSLTRVRLFFRGRWREKGNKLKYILIINKQVERELILKYINGGKNLQLQLLQIIVRCGLWYSGDPKILGSANEKTKISSGVTKFQRCSSSASVFFNLFNSNTGSCLSTLGKCVRFQHVFIYWLR